MLDQLSNRRRLSCSTSRTGC